MDQLAAILDQAIAELDAHPVDLLNIGDQAGERNYLRNARHSYLCTLRDLTALTVETAASPAPPRVLEIGAYLGVVSVCLARLGWQVTALDIPEFMANAALQERYRRTGIEAVAADLGNGRLPLQSAGYDVVVMCETLEHLNFNPLPVMQEIGRVLKAGGCLYLALPNLASLPNRVNLLLGRSIHNPIRDFVAQHSGEGNMIVGIHWREYTREELRELLAVAGFQWVWHAYRRPVRASTLAFLMYGLFPSLRPSQSLLARKLAGGVVPAAQLTGSAPTKSSDMAGS